MEEIIIKVIIAVSVLSILGAILGCAIGLCSKLFYVKEDKRLEKILPLLPGANCGGCGYAGCAGFAKAIVDDNVSISNCKPLKTDKANEINIVLEEFNKIIVEIEGNLKNNQKN